VKAGPTAPQIDQTSGTTTSATTNHQTMAIATAMSRRFAAP
jgi:hypothetical protein